MSALGARVSADIATRPHPGLASFFGGKVARTRASPATKAVGAELGTGSSCEVPVPSQRIRDTASSGEEGEFETMIRLSEIERQNLKMR